MSAHLETDVTVSYSRFMIHYFTVLLKNAMMFFCLFFVALSLTSRDRLRILRLRRRIRFGCVQCQRIPPSFARNGGERTGTFVTTNATFVQQLQELTKLFEAGHLSNQEYASAKAKVLSSI